MVFILLACYAMYVGSWSSKFRGKHFGPSLTVKHFLSHNSRSWRDQSTQCRPVGLTIRGSISDRGKTFSPVENVQIDTYRPIPSPIQSVPESLLPEVKRSLREVHPQLCLLQTLRISRAYLYSTFMMGSVSPETC